MARILLRADGSSVIGMGHLSRVVCLAKMLQPAFDCRIVSNRPDIAERLGAPANKTIRVPDFNYTPPDKKAESEELPFDLSSILKEDDIVVTDGYWMGRNYQRQVKQLARKLVVIDDLAQPGYFYDDVDVILNHAPALNAQAYHFIQSDLLLGHPYVLLKEPFLQRARQEVQPKFNPGFRKVFVGFGGSDIMKDLTQQVITTLASMDHVEEIFTVSNEPVALPKTRSFPLLNTEELIGLVDDCDLVVTPASTMSLEMCALRKPLVAIKTAENQSLIYEGLKKLRVAIAITRDEVNSLAGALIKANEAFLIDQLGQQQRAIDGLSGVRLLKYFETL